MNLQLETSPAAVLHRDVEYSPMQGCSRLSKSLKQRHKLELPKSDNTQEHSARFAARRDGNNPPAPDDDQRQDVLRTLSTQLQQLEQSEFDLDSCATLIRRCSSFKALDHGQRLHKFVKDRQSNHIFLNNLLVLMYGSCNRVDQAREVFDSISQKNTHSWNIMISAYARNGYSREAVDLFWEMTSSSTVKPCSVTYCSVLGICSRMGAIEDGRAIHRQISGTIFESFGGLGSVGTALINMYGKCASPDEARVAFNRLTDRSNVCWNAMISAYAQNNRDSEAINLFRSMDHEGIRPTEFTFVSVIDACPSKALGKQIHARVAALGFMSDLILTSAMVNMYGKLGLLQEARWIFDGMEQRNCFTWSGLIAAYAQHGHGREALELFRRMDVPPNNVTLISVLDACAQIGDSETGKLVHSMFVPDGKNSDITLSNALINMYGKCGLCAMAKEVFDSMPRKSVISWTSMISAYSRGGFAREALEIFDLMEAGGIQPNELTIVSVLDACSSAGLIKEGRRIHQGLLQRKIKPDGVLGNAIVSMYGKCGSLMEAMDVFSRMRSQCVVSWTSLIAANAQKGEIANVLLILKTMSVEGFDPDDITFVSLLFACSHAGKLEAGREVFQAMISDFFCAPTAEHYRCLVDLLSRTGKLNEAEELVRSMPFEEDLQSWSTLLSGCKLHRNEEHGQVAADKLVEVSPDQSRGYLLLSQLHAQRS